MGEDVEGGPVSDAGVGAERVETAPEIKHGGEHGSLTGVGGHVGLEELRVGPEGGRECHSRAFLDVDACYFPAQADEVGC